MNVNQSWYSQSTQTLKQEHQAGAGLDTWQLFSSSMTSLFSLLMSHTQMNSASLWPLKNFSRILCTTATAERPLGTEQFSMSQKTPMGGRFSRTWPVTATSGDPVQV